MRAVAPATEALAFPYLGRGKTTKQMKILSPEHAARLRQFLADSGYEEDNLREKLGLSELPSSRLRNLARLLDGTRENTCLNSLLRWFWIGVPVDSATAQASVPPWFTDLGLDCTASRGCRENRSRGDAGSDGRACGSLRPHPAH